MGYYGDPKMYEVGDGTDLTITAGQPEMDEGLANSIYISLFSDRGYWGNALAADAEKIGSRFGGILSKTLTNAVRLDAEEYARAALAWMVSEGIASEITIEALIPGVNMLGLFIKIVQPERTVTAKYDINWATMAVRVGVA